MKKIKAIVWVIPIIVATGLYLWIHTAVSAKTLAAPAAKRISWEGAKQITAVSTEASGPVIAVAPDNSTITVAYSQEKEDENTAFDVYYTQSTNQGDSWSITRTIHHDAAKSSIQVDIDYDANNVAHAVWVIKPITAADDPIIAYASEPVWLSNVPTTLDAGSSMQTPVIVASDPNTLDVLWSGLKSAVGGFGIYHTRSTDGGANWLPAPTKINTSATVPPTAPALAVDGSKLYAAWEDNPHPPSTQGVIYYTESNNTLSWATPVPISDPNHNAHEPAILIDDIRIAIVYTHREGKSNQWLYRTTCLLTSDCTQTTSWTPHVDIEQISGAAVGVNAESPWNVFSDLIEYDGCTYAHFHGTSPIFAQENEVIWSTSSCNEWTINDDTQALTAPQVQTIFPSLGKDDTYLYLVYQQNKVGDETHQIYFQRGITGPLVPRNRLTITYEGNGEGSIDLRPHNTPAGNVCTGSCIRAFDVKSVDPSDLVLKTTVVRMYSTAADGSTFEGFTGDAGCTEWTVSMGTDMACTAHFSRAAFVYLPIILK